MLAPAVVVVLSLAAQGEARALQAEYWEPTGEPYCESEDVSVFEPQTTFSTSTTAPLGGAWWLPRLSAFFTADELLVEPDRLELIGGDGNPVEVLMHATAAVVAIDVPESAADGATFLLRSTTNPGNGRVLHVGPEAPRGAQAVGFELTAGPKLDAQCWADCDDGMDYTIPGAPQVDLTFTGAPVVVDIWRLTPGTEIVDGEAEQSIFADRLVDSRLLEEGTTRLVIDADSAITTAPVRIEVRDPLTLEVLFLDEPNLTWESATFDAEELTSCEDYADGYYDDCCYEDDYYCGAAGGEGPWSLLAAFAGLAFLRRRRRGGAQR